jgi:hypothetical protein
MSTTYEVRVRTGVRGHAGTNSKIYLKLIGRTASSDLILLNDKPFKKVDDAGEVIKSGDAFTRGHTDIFRITIDEDLGPLYGIEIESSGTGRHAGWDLSRITIEDGGEKVKFSIDKMIEKDRHSFQRDDWPPKLTYDGSTDWQAVQDVVVFDYLDSKAPILITKELRKRTFQKTAMSTDTQENFKIGTEVGYESPEATFGKFQAKVSTEYAKEWQTHRDESSEDEVEKKVTFSFTKPKGYLTIARYSYRVPYKRARFGLTDKDSLAVRVLDEALFSDVDEPDVVLTLKRGEFKKIPPRIRKLIKESSSSIDLEWIRDRLAPKVAKRKRAVQRV